MSNNHPVVSALHCPFMLNQKICIMLPHESSATSARTHARGIFHLDNKIKPLNPLPEILPRGEQGPLMSNQDRMGAVLYRNKFLCKETNEEAVLKRWQ